MVTGGEGASKQYISMNAVHKINPYWVGHISLLTPGTLEQISRTFGVWFYTRMCVQTLLLDCAMGSYCAVRKQAGGSTSFARRMWSRARWLRAGQSMSAGWRASWSRGPLHVSLARLCFRVLDYLHVKLQLRWSYCCSAVSSHLPSANLLTQKFQKTFPMRMAGPNRSQIPWQVSQRKNTAFLALWSISPQNSPYYVNACTFQLISETRTNFDKLARQVKQ